MLARNSYTQAYVNHARAQFDTEFGAFETVRSAASARERTALEAFEALMVRHLVLALDGYFTHRTRGQEKKDGSPSRKCGGSATRS